jgi:hypothetical protein
MVISITKVQALTVRTGFKDQDNHGPDALQAGQKNQLTYQLFNDDVTHDEMLI